MPRYLSLVEYTDQGIRNVKDTIGRANAFRSSIEAADGKVISLYWAVGEADGVAIFETPNEETAAKLLLALGEKGNVRTKTLRVYNEEEFAEILSKT